MAQNPAATIFLEQWLAICDPKKNSTDMSLAMYNSNVAELQASVTPTDKLTSRQHFLIEKISLNFSLLNIYTESHVIF